MNAGLKIITEQVQANVTVTVLHLDGWLDAQSEEQLLQVARVAHDGGARYLLLDMKDIDTLTSAGMRAIQKVYKLYTPPDAQFKTARIRICSAPPQVHHILGITGFLQNIPSYETTQAAVDSFE
jgi:anti-anti-sigma factor